MDKRQIDLCRYRLEKAKKCMQSAKLLEQSEDYCSAANRSYYSIFHCIRSLLALEGIDFSKHSGVMAYFQKIMLNREYSGKNIPKSLQKPLKSEVSPIMMTIMLFQKKM